jgi:HB1/ASXL restriction endonuclease-like protein with HTH domain
MPNLSWKDAIIRVLQDSPGAMHYTEIAEAIAKQNLRSRRYACVHCLQRDLNLDERGGQLPVY